MQTTTPRAKTFEERVGHYAIRNDDGAAATTFARSQFDALMKARNLWPQANEWKATFIPGAK